MSLGVRAYAADKHPHRGQAGRLCCFVDGEWQLVFLKRAQSLGASQGVIQVD